MRPLIRYIAKAQGYGEKNTIKWPITSIDELKYFDERITMEPEFKHQVVNSSIKLHLLKTKLFLVLSQNTKLRRCNSGSKNLRKIVGDDVFIHFTTSKAHLNVAGKEKKRPTSESPLLEMIAGKSSLF